ncbi:MAG: tetratricopeptide repeat protein [Draconibacterium sp.]
MKKTRLLFLLILTLFAISVSAQTPTAQDIVNEGIKYHDEGNYPKAIETYKKALEINPNSGLALYEMALTYFTIKDYQNAEIASKKAIDANDDHKMHAYMMLGNSLDMLGEPKKAIKAYEKAIKDYDNYLLYYNYALACLNAGETEKAYDAAIKAILNNSSHASGHLILSQVMEKKGSRIKAMLPLYFFLMLEPNSARSEVNYKALRGFIDLGVTQTSKKNINVSVPTDKDADFGAAEMMISLSRASNALEENKDKTDLELFANNNEKIFLMLGELKKENTGFWWDFYVPFFYEMATKNLVKPYSYYISQSAGEEAGKWIEENEAEFEKFKNWVNN